MSKPYRVIVWGPGSVGRACLRELIRRPEFEIVGVLGYSPAKNGLDVGELLGQAPVGVKITTDKESIFDLDADCVLWTGTMPFAHVVDEMDRDVIRLLESGKHVISPVAYHYPPAHGPEYVRKFDEACRKGKSCLHGTGENPGFWFERVALTLTGICNEVEYIRLDEYADCATGGTSGPVLHSVGFGMTVDEASVPGPIAEMWNKYYFVETLNMASVSLYGKPLERFEDCPIYHVTDQQIVLDTKNGDLVDLTVEKGRVSAMTHNLTGWVDGEPKLKISVNWFLSPKHSPFGKDDSTWDIEIEGRPTSIKCSIRALASAKDNLEFRAGDSTSPTWYATAMPAIQAIPVVCGHEPGIVYPTIFASCSPDLHLLETRKSIVS